MEGESDYLGFAGGFVGGWRRGLLAAAGVLLLASVRGVAGAADGELVALRETIAKIVDVKAQASKERLEWEGRKEEMAALLEVHRKELELLGEELAGSGTSVEAYDGEARTVEAELEALRQARRAAGEVVVRNRGRMLALAEAFPLPLAEDVEPERLSLERWARGDEPRDGLQAILGMVAKAEQFNRRITRAREVRNGREVEVIYLGLARAYYADRSGNAGVGSPAAGGWSWVADRGLNGEVVKALDELDRKRPPELVDLPVKIGGLGE